MKIVVTKACQSTHSFGKLSFAQPFSEIPTQKKLWPTTPLFIDPICGPVQTMKISSGKIRQLFYEKLKLNINPSFPKTHISLKTTEKTFQGDSTVFESHQFSYDTHSPSNLLSRIKEPKLNSAVSQNRQDSRVSAVFPNIYLYVYIVPKRSLRTSSKIRLKPALSFISVQL